MPKGKKTAKVAQPAQNVELLAGTIQSGESARAVQAANDFLRMGAGRSLRALLDSYLRPTKTDQNLPPTTSMATLKGWSSDYQWEARAAEYDGGIVEAQKNARRREIMEEGLALDYERVAELKNLAGFLREQLYERGDNGAYHNVWVPDVRQVGSGQFAIALDIERFNPAIIDQYRGTLKDIAEEVGGRKQNAAVEVTGKGGGPIEHAGLPTVNIYMPDNGRDTTPTITDTEQDGDGEAK